MDGWEKMEGEEAKDKEINIEMKECLDGSLKEMNSRTAERKKASR